MAPRLSAADVISLLGLAPLEGEGGFFRQTLYVPGDQDAAPPRATAILYLITPDTWSALHRLTTDELFHFYLGDPCRMVVCSPDGAVEERLLGTDLRAGCTVQTLVPGGWWQGTMLEGRGEHGFALLGTTMTPGFRADQFSLGTESDLAEFSEPVATRLRPFLASQQRRREES